MQKGPPSAKVNYVAGMDAQNRFTRSSALKTEIKVNGTNH